MNELKHLAEFKKLLANYSISPQATKVLEQVRFAPLAAISSSGRNTIIRELLKTNEFYFIVSDTTRKKRLNDGVLERDGVEYWFRDEAVVLADVKAGRYIAPAVIHNQQVSGINITELERARDENKVAVSDIEVKGVADLMKASKNIIPIFVLPPSYEEWMHRWSRRGDISEAERANRIASAKFELQTVLDAGYYHILVNDNLDHAVKGLRKIVQGDIDPRHEEEGKQVAYSILQRIESII